MSGASKKRCQTNIVRLRRKELPPAGTFCAAPAPTLGTATKTATSGAHGASAVRVGLARDVHADRRHN